MTSDPAFGPKVLAPELGAAIDDIVAVIDARFACHTSTGTRSAWGFVCIPQRSGRQLSPPPDFTKHRLSSQTGWANPRATLAAVAMEQVPLP